MLIILKMYWPLAFLPLPWIMRAILSRAATMDTGLLRVPFFSSINALANRRERDPSGTSRGLRLLSYLIWLLLIIAACGPQYIGDPVNIRDKARDLMLAVDLSNSMKIDDMRLNGEQVDRLTVVKNVLNDFIKKRTGDRMGLILFGTHAYLQTPLTFDRVTLKKLLDEAQIGMAGPATAIGDAIGLALKRMKDRPSKSKVLILLTDGANTAGEISPMQAARLAAEKGLKIYTVGIGADEMIIPGLLGTNFGARRINPSADLDKAALTGIAKVTGGKFFRAKNTESLRNIYHMLDQLEPVETDPETFRPIKSLFYYPLGLALLLSTLIALNSVARNAMTQHRLKVMGRQIREQEMLP